MTAHDPRSGRREPSQQVGRLRIDHFRGDEIDVTLDLAAGTGCHGVVVVDREGIIKHVSSDNLPVSIGSRLTDWIDDGDQLTNDLRRASHTSDPVPIGFSMDGRSTVGIAHRVDGGDIAITLVGAAMNRLSTVGGHISRLNRALRERDRALASLAESNSKLNDLQLRYQSLVDPSPNAIVLLNDDLQVVAFNPAANALWNLESLLVGMSCLEILAADIGAAIRAASQRRRYITLRGVELGGEHHASHWFDLSISPVPTGGIHLVASDVTERVAFERRLTALATSDPLTGLGNRSRLHDRIAVGLRALQGAEIGLAVVAIDIDHFKLVNDTQGHGAGDLLLIRVARRIESLLGKLDTVCRVGGDEFVVVLRDRRSDVVAENLIKNIHASVIDGTESIGGLAPSLSLGYTWVDNAATTVEEVLSQADSALYESKRSGRNRVTRHDPVLYAWPFPSEGELVGALHGALERGEFELHYQPITDVEGRPRAIEALLRWRHPEMGLLLPAVFVDRLIDTGMIIPVGKWVVEEACRRLSAWHKAGLVDADISIHVNVAPSQLVDPHLIIDVATALEAEGLSPEMLCLEMTEQALSARPASRDALKRLGDLGVRVALDDFGTGTSSLTHLRDPSVQQVKIDRSFVAAIDVDRRTEQITSGLIALSAELDITVVGEGVETSEQLAWLVDHGCRWIQGFFVSEPVTASELPDRLRLLA